MLSEQLEQRRRAALLRADDDEVERGLHPRGWYRQRTPRVTRCLGLPAHATRRNATCGSDRDHRNVALGHHARRPPPRVATGRAPRDRAPHALEGGQLPPSARRRRRRRPSRRGVDTRRAALGRGSAHPGREVTGQLLATRPRASRLSRRPHRLHRARRRAVHRLELPPDTPPAIVEAVDRHAQVPDAATLTSRPRALRLRSPPRCLRGSVALAPGATARLGAVLDLRHEDAVAAPDEGTVALRAEDRRLRRHGAARRAARVPRRGVPDRQGTEAALRSPLRSEPHDLPARSAAIGSGRDRAPV